MGSIQMEGVILNNCVIVDLDVKHTVLFYFVSALFSQVQGNAGQVGSIPPAPIHREAEVVDLHGQDHHQVRGDRNHRHLYVQPPSQD